MSRERSGSLSPADKSKSRSRSRSRSYTPKKKRSRSPSYSPSPKRRSYTPSPRRRRSYSPYSPRKKRSYSRSYSRSRSRSYSRSRSPRYRRKRSYSPRRSYRHRSRDRWSPMGRRGGRHGHGGNRINKYNPPPNNVIGIFGLSLATCEQDLRDILERFGELKEIQIVYDHQTGKSRGFAFVYFDDLQDAIEAKESCNGIDLDGRKIRVDYSVTKRAHTPTPGVYMGKPTRPPRDGYRDRRDDYDRDRRDDYDRDRHNDRDRDRDRGSRHY